METAVETHSDTRPGTKYEVLVVVAPRPPYKGFWSGAMFWAEGSTKKVVTHAQFLELKHDADLHFIAVETLRTIVPPQEAKR